MTKTKDFYKIWITNPRRQDDSYKKEKKNLRKEGGDGGSFGGGTVAVASNSGFFTPTYGGNGKKKRKKRTGIDKFADFVTDNSPEKKMIKDLFSFVVKALKKDEKKFQTGKTFRQQTSSMSMNDNIARVDYKKAWMGGYQADALATAGDKDKKQYVIDEIEEETEEREFH